MLNKTILNELNFIEYKLMLAKIMRTNQFLLKVLLAL
jgi:hypothetical protein